MEPPKYRRHPNGLAFVCHRSIPTRSHRLYLGTHGTEKSLARYQAFLARLAAGDPAPAINLSAGRDQTIAELSVPYVVWAESYYPHDKANNELENVKAALTHLVRLYGDVPASTFGPKSLLALQTALAQQGYARSVVNSRVGKVKLFFKWAVSREHLPVAVYQALATVPGLRRGRSQAREPAPVQPVAWDAVQVLLPHVSPVVAAMVRTQWYCGMRPEEVCEIRRGDIVQAWPDVWLVYPEGHKNQWREGVAGTLVKAVPRVAQAVLSPYLERPDGAFLFTPAESEAWRLANRPAYSGRARKTPLYPSEVRRLAAAKRLRLDQAQSATDGTPYTVASYRRAITYGFARAERERVQRIETARQRGIDVTKLYGPPLLRWSPNQLRHGVATWIKQEVGPEAAQTWLGHARLSTTEIYMARETRELIALARQLDQRWAG